MSIAYDYQQENRELKTQFVRDLLSSEIRTLEEKVFGNEYFHPKERLHFEEWPEVLNTLYREVMDSLRGMHFGGHSYSGKEISEKCHYLRKLILEKKNNLDDAGLLLAKYCPLMKELDAEFYASSISLKLAEDLAKIDPKNKKNIWKLRNQEMELWNDKLSMSNRSIMVSRFYENDAHLKNIFVEALGYFESVAAGFVPDMSKFQSRVSSYNDYQRDNMQACLSKMGRLNEYLQEWRMQKGEASCSAIH